MFFKQYFELEQYKLFLNNQLFIKRERFQKFIKMLYCDCEKKPIFLLIVRKTKQNIFTQSKRKTCLKVWIKNVFSWGLMMLKPGQIILLMYMIFGVFLTICNCMAVLFIVSILLCNFTGKPSFVLLAIFVVVVDFLNFSNSIVFRYIKKWAL